MGIKIAIIGSGSTYTPELIEGLINRKDSLPLDELYLMDIDERKRTIVGGLGQRMIQAAGMETKVVLKENELLVHLIANHLIEIETLTKEDIYELVETGQLSWWEKKKAKAEAERIAKEKEQELQDIYKKQLEAMKNNVESVKEEKTE